MKNIILIACMLLASMHYGYSKEHTGNNENIPMVISYGVEGTLIYEVKNCIPRSDIAFYSEKHGGHLLKTAVVNEDGSVVVKSKSDFTPAFVLSVKKKNTQGVKGNGKVTFTGKHCFDLKKIEADNKAGIVNIKWEAAVNDKSKYRFEVYKSIDGRVYTKVYSIPARAESMTDYVFNEQEKDKNASYQIKVVNDADGITYTSKLLTFMVNEDILLYPTVTNNVINVLVSDARTSNRFNVTNLNGQVVLSGELIGMKTSIDVEKLPPGDYVLSVGSNHTAISRKFTKL